MTREDFNKALATNPFEKIVQNSVQHPAAEGCTASHKKNQGSQKANKKGHLHVPAPQCNPLQMALAPPVGLEQSAVSSVIHDVLDSDCAAECATPCNLDKLKQDLASLSRDELLEILLSVLEPK